MDHLGPEQLHVLQVTPLEPHAGYLHRAPHSFHELVLVTGGRYRVELDGRIVEGLAGDVFVYPRNLHHVPRHDLDRGTHLMLAQFLGCDELVQRLPRKAADASARVFGALQWLWEWGGREDVEQQRTAPSLMWAVLQELVALGRQGRGLNDRVARAADYMRRKLEVTVTREEVARVAGVGPSQLTRLFQSAYGMPPMQYLNRLRVEKALNLLKDPNLTLREIARRVGLSSPGYLSRLIRRTTGRPLPR